MWIGAIVITTSLSRICGNDSHDSATGMPHRSRGAFPPLPPSEERQGNAAQPHTARQPRTHRGRRAFSHDSPLAKGAKQAYKKGERRILLLHRFQRRHGRFAPPPHARLPPLTIFFDPDPSSLGRGQLFLIGVRCQQQDKGHSDKQDEKTSPHGCPSLSMCAVPGARSGGQPCTRGSRAVFSAPGKARRFFDLRT